jgi:hypothetical protein
MFMERRSNVVGASTAQPSLLWVMMLAVVLFGIPPVHSQGVAPERLTIGYDNEGKIDATARACAAFIDQEMEGATKSDKRRYAAQVCAARQRHVAAYDALQKNYKALAALINKDHRLRVDEAVANLKSLVKSCIDHKFAMSASGGHNYRIDIIPNEMAAACLTIAANMVKTEAAALKAEGEEYCSLDAQKYGC